MVRNEFQKLVVHELEATGMRLNKLLDNHLQTDKQELLNIPYRQTNGNSSTLAFKGNQEPGMTEVRRTLRRSLFRCYCLLGFVFYLCIYFLYEHEYTVALFRPTRRGIRSYYR